MSANDNQNQPQQGKDDSGTVDQSGTDSQGWTPRDTDRRKKFREQNDIRDGGDFTEGDNNPTYPNPNAPKPDDGTS